jgi:hypothetical protein
MSTKEQKERIELLQSMLELLILRTLLPGRRTALPSPDVAGGTELTLSGAVAVDQPRMFFGGEGHIAK